MVLKLRLKGFEPLTFGTEIRSSIQLSYKRFNYLFLMIQQQTILNVSDNSGAKKVKCIKVLGGFKKKVSFVGDFIIVSVIELRNKSKKLSKVKKGEIYKALIIKTKKKIQTKDGSIYFFKKNAVSLISKQGKPLASRIIGPLPKKLKKSKYSKFNSLAPGTV